MQKKNKLTIAVDGYASCGKSTFAKKIAQALHYKYIDSGAMYRAATLFFMHNNIIHDQDIDINMVEKLLGGLNISFDFDPESMNTITYLNNVNIEKEIRDQKVSGLVSLVSKIKPVREKMVDIQQTIGRKGGVVMDGRDIGTVVFPDAEIKVFMTADIDIRAQRRYKEMQEKGVAQSFNAVKNNLEERDRIDENREISPLKKAIDALVLDNSNMSIDEQMDWIMQIIKQKQKE